jgi:hypothetical protein
LENGYFSGGCVERGGFWSEASIQDARGFFWGVTRDGVPGWYEAVRWGWRVLLPR